MTQNFSEPASRQASQAKTSLDHSKTVAFYTLGCKTNQLETTTLAQDFKQSGWDVRPFDEPASLYVINTCTVTERSDLESQRLVRRARLSNPHAQVALTGCYAQVAPDEVAALPGVNYVIGNGQKEDLRRIIEANPPTLQPLIQVTEIDKSRIMEGASYGGLERTRGSLKIQDGCDYKCTYCIIWEARGKSRCLSVADVQRSLQQMVWEGFKEIVLTGINIGQYEDSGQDLSGLLETLVQVDGDFRLRLSSLDPLEVTEDLIKTMAAHRQKICPHVHLSAQSAEDTMLRRMGRRHHVADMVRICETIAAHIPDASIGSDIIVGFPGESDASFEATYETLAAVPMNYFHVFSYSKRRGTPAAGFDEQVPERIKKLRAQRLKDLSDQKHWQFREQFLKTPREVVVEETCKKAMSDNYIRVKLQDPEAYQPNDKVLVQFESIDGDYVLAKSMSPQSVHSPA